MSAVAHEPRPALEGESPRELSLVDCDAHHNWRGVEGRAALPAPVLGGLRRREPVQIAAQLAVSERGRRRRAGRCPSRRCRLRWIGRRSLSPPAARRVGHRRRDPHRPVLQRGLSRQCRVCHGAVERAQRLDDRRLVEPGFALSRLVDRPHAGSSGGGQRDRPPRLAAGHRPDSLFGRLAHAVRAAVLRSHLGSLRAQRSGGRHALRGHRDHAPADVGRLAFLLSGVAHRHVPGVPGANDQSRLPRARSRSSPD